MNFYKRYPGDYGRDTAHLSLMQHGAYTLLLDHCYSTELPLPADMQSLYRICRAFEKAEQKAVQAVAEQFFPVAADGLRHNARFDRQLPEEQLGKDTARENGKKGGRPRKNNPTDQVSQTEPTENPAGFKTETQRVSQTEPTENPAGFHDDSKTGQKQPQIRPENGDENFSQHGGHSSGLCNDKSLNFIETENPAGFQKETQRVSQTEPSGKAPPTPYPNNTQKYSSELGEGSDTETRARPRAPSRQVSTADHSCIPFDFVPDQSHQTLASNLGLNLSLERDKFVDHYTANSELRSDWSAQFRKWLRDAPKHGDSRYAGSGQHSPKITEHQRRQDATAREIYGPFLSELKARATPAANNGNIIEGECHADTAKRLG